MASLCRWPTQCPESDVSELRTGGQGVGLTVQRPELLDHPLGTMCSCQQEPKLDVARGDGTRVLARGGLLLQGQ